MPGRGHRARAVQRRSEWLDEASDQHGARRTVRRATSAAPATGDVISVLARAVREVEAAVQRGPVTPAVRTKFQVIALLLREEHARVRAGETGTEARRAEQLKRLDGIATILARTAVRDTALLALLAEDAVVSAAAAALARRDARARRAERRPRSRPRRRRRPAAATAGRRAPGRAAVGRLPAAGQPLPRPRLRRRPAEPGPGRSRLAGWELLGPLLRSFERAGGGSPGVHAAARAVRRCRRPAAWS